MSTGRVLIVDDDFDIRDALADVLQAEGYDVHGVADGELALEYLRANPAPALIILDWMMPNCDGPHFRKLQREDAAIANIPVVLLTADARITEKSAEVQVDDYLKKPVQLDRLLAVVRRFCG